MIFHLDFRLFYTKINLASHSFLSLNYPIFSTNDNSSNEANVESAALLLAPLRTPYNSKLVSLCAARSFVLQTATASINRGGSSPPADPRRTPSPRVQCKLSDFFLLIHVIIIKWLIRNTVILLLAHYCDCDISTVFS